MHVDIFYSLITFSFSLPRFFKVGTIYYSEFTDHNAKV